MTDLAEPGDRLAAAVERGQKAEALLKSELLKEAFAELEAEYLRAWRESDDPDEREGLHCAVRILDRVRGHLETVVGGGTIAAHEIDQELHANYQRLGR